MAFQSNSSFLGLFVFVFSRCCACAWLLLTCFSVGWNYEFLYELELQKPMLKKLELLR